jgi:AraC-like DNA-binding protein
MIFLIKVETRLKPEMIEVIERMISECSNAYPGKQDILRWLLKIFLIYVNRHQRLLGQQPAYLTQSGLASMFFGLLEKNYASRKMVADYAQDLSVTPNYLNETVKKASGYPASYHIQQRIILEAKRKATHVRKSMKEIAYDLGFDDISHFSKYFKKVSGVSFSEFKKELSHQLAVTADFYAR